LAELTVKLRQHSENEILGSFGWRFLILWSTWTQTVLPV
jgi:hypothetical protein